MIGATDGNTVLDALELRTPEGRFGFVGADGRTSDDRTAGFLDKLAVPGGLVPGDPGYLEALYWLLRSGTYLWAQPAAVSSDDRSI